MNKILYFLIFCFWNSAFAENQPIVRVFTPSTEIDLSYINNGRYITITGVNGGDITDGILEVSSDKRISTLKNIVTEVRKYNELSGMVGPILNNSDANEVIWALENKSDLIINDVTSIDSDYFIFRLNGKNISEHSLQRGKPSDLSSVYWGVHSNDVLDDIHPGDSFYLDAMVSVTVEF
ncbi:TPA: hypothetical protein ACX6RV_000977 [Photobacterium damselae]